MDVEFVQSGNPKGGAKPRVDLPASPIHYLLLVVYGQTASGEDLTPADLGKYRLKRFGEQFQGSDFDTIHEIANIRRGYPTNTGGGGSQNRIAVPIFMGYSQIPNIMDVGSKEEADLEIDFDAVLDTRFGGNSATYELYAVTAPGLAELYTLKLQEANVQFSGATRSNDSFSAKNIAEVYMQDPSGIVNSVQLKFDNSVVVDNLDDDVLQDLTNLNNRIETSGLATREVYSPSTDDIRETLNGNVTYSLEVSAGGTVEFTLLSTRFNEERTAQSISRAKRFRESRVQSFGSVEGLPSGAVAT